MRQTPPPRHLARYVEELIECGVQLAQILDHMYTSPLSNPHGPGPPEVLRDLVAGTLERSLGPRKRAVREATALLVETGQAVSREIYLVDHEWAERVRAREDLDDWDDPEDLEYDDDPRCDDHGANDNGRGPSGGFLH